MAFGGTGARTGFAGAEFMGFEGGGGCGCLEDWPAFPGGLAVGFVLLRRPDIVDDDTLAERPQSDSCHGLTDR